MRTSLKRNIGWNLLGNLTYGACQWGMLLATARLGTPADVGIIALGLAICSPVFIFSNMGLRTQWATDVAGKYRPSLYLLVRGATSSIAIAFICLALVAYRPAPETWAVIVAMAAYKWSEALSDITYGYHQLTDSMQNITRSLTLRGIGSLATYILVLYVTNSVPLSAYSFAVVGFAVLIFNDLAVLAGKIPALLRTIVSTAGTLAQSNVRALILSSVPLGIAASAASLEVAAPRIIVGGTLGERHVGVLAVISSFAVIAALCMNAMSQALLPHFARLFAQSEYSSARKLLRQVCMALATLGLLIIGLAYLIGSDVLRIVFGPEYAAFRTPLTIIAASVAAGLISWVLNSYIFAYGAGRSVAIANVISLSIVILGSWLLVKPFGLDGIALAMLAGALIQVIVKTASIRSLNIGVHESSTSPVGDHITTLFKAPQSGGSIS